MLILKPLQPLQLIIKTKLGKQKKREEEIRQLVCEEGEKQLFIHEYIKPGWLDSGNNGPVLNPIRNFFQVFLELSGKQSFLCTDSQWETSFPKPATFTILLHKMICAEEPVSRSR